MSRILDQNWSAIVRRFGDMVPVHSTSARGKIVPAKEYGCGSYGCILPTTAPGIVFKVTSDATEAAFVTAAMQVLVETEEWPEGIVRYHGLFQVPEGSHKKRPVYVLARQEAEEVGQLAHPAQDNLADFHGMPSSQQYLLEKRVAKRLARFKQYASVARDKIVKSASPRRVITEIKALESWAEEAVDYEEASSLRDTYPPRPALPRAGAGMYWSKYTGARAAAYAVRACHIVAEEMINEDVGYLIGRAFQFYLEHGMLLADVHLGNIGKIEVENYKNKQWAITDPGHMVPLDVRWLDLEVPVL